MPAMIVSTAPVAPGAPVQRGERKQPRNVRCFGRISTLFFDLAHVLIGKAVPTFPGHALAARRRVTGRGDLGMTMSHARPSLAKRRIAQNTGSNSQARRPCIAACGSAW